MQIEYFNAIYIGSVNSNQLILIS